MKVGVDRRVALVCGCLAEGVRAGEMNEALAQKVLGARLAVAGFQTVAGMVKTAVEPVGGLVASVLQVVAVRGVGS